MKVKKGCFPLYCVFAVMFLWDYIERFAPKIQFLLLLIPFFLCLKIEKKSCFTINFVLFACFVFIHGILNIVVKNDKFDLFIIQYGSIFFCFVVFGTIIRNYSVNKIVCVYWNFAFIMSLIGVLEVFLCMFKNPDLAKLPLVFTNTDYFSNALWNFPRVCALCQEPSFLGYFLAPAMCIIIFRMFAPKYLLFNDFAFINSRIQRVCIMISYLMTFSFVAYVGLALMFFCVLFSVGISKKIFFILLGAIVMIVIVYSFVPDIRMRVNDTIAVFVGLKSGDMVNITSYTYYSNWIVMLNSIKSTFGLGTGLGSYRFMFDKFNLGEWGQSGIIFNREDGNSMFFRIMVELGLFGFFVLVYFLKKYFPKYKNFNYVIGISLFVLMIMLLIRMGNYTHGALILFVCLYRKCHTEYEEFIKNRI